MQIREWIQSHLVLSVAAAVAVVLLVWASPLSNSANKVAADGSSTSLDFATAELLEQALNNGEAVVGKTACFTVDDLRPDGVFGFTIWTGEHLNFISEEDPGVREGDAMTVRITKVETFLGSWLLRYEIVK